MDLTTGNAALSVAIPVDATRSGTEAAKTKSSLSALTSAAFMATSIPPVASHRGRWAMKYSPAIFLALLLCFVSGCTTPTPGSADIEVYQQFRIRLQANEERPYRIPVFRRDFTERGLLLYLAEVSKQARIRGIAIEAETYTIDVDGSLAEPIREFARYHHIPFVELTPPFNSIDVEGMASATKHGQAYVENK